MDCGKIKKLHDKLVKKELSSVELTKQYLDAIKREDPSLNAYVAVTEEYALEQASSADKRIAEDGDIPILCGIPMTLKDNMSTDGLPTTCCSKILQGYNPIYDATVWKKLKSEGAVLLGKTNMDEFAMGSSNESSYYGPALNPYDKTRVAGGSSGGVASAVAAGLAAYGLGSDTGGSIRQPASFCGLVGLKPTYGAVSRFGLIAYGSGFDQIGPIAHSAQDASVVYDAISGYDEMDSTSDPSLVSRHRDSSRPLRIALPREYFDGVSEEIKNSIYKALEVFRSQGAIIEEVSLSSIKYSLPVYYILACAEASSNLGRYDGIRYGYRTSDYKDLNEMVCRTRSEGFGKEVQRRILLGTYVLSSGYYDAYYKKAQTLRRVIIKEFETLFGEWDIIACPTVPSTAFRLGENSSDPVQAYLTDICTVTANITGIPAISIPCGKDKDGLPIGLQLMANRGEDGLLLSVACEYERERGSVCEVSSMGVRI